MDLPDDAFASLAKLSHKRIGTSPLGVLSLAGGRLRFDDLKKGFIFDQPLSAVSAIETPGWMLGSGFRFHADGTRYFCGFYDTAEIRYPSTDPVGEIVTAVSAFKQVASARQLCQAWLTLLRLPPA